MGWLSLASGLVKLLNIVTGYMKDKQLLDAGDARAISRSLTAVGGRLEKARKAQIRLRNDPEYRDRMRERSTRDE